MFLSYKGEMQGLRCCSVCLTRSCYDCLLVLSSMLKSPSEDFSGSTKPRTINKEIQVKYS